MMEGGEEEVGEDMFGSGGMGLGSERAEPIEEAADLLLEVETVMGGLGEGDLEEKAPPPPPLPLPPAPALAPAPVLGGRMMGDVMTWVLATVGLEAYEQGMRERKSL